MSESPGCAFCRDTVNRSFGHLDYVGVEIQSGFHLLRCPRCSSLYEDNTHDDPTPISVEEATARWDYTPGSADAKRYEGEHHGAISDGFVVSTERLGWPPRPRGWRRLRFGEIQRGMVYADRPGQPSATCHLQRIAAVDALCGYPTEQLVPIPDGPGWMDLHPILRCSECGKVAGIPKENPEGRQYRHSWQTKR